MVVTVHRRAGGGGNVECVAVNVVLAVSDGCRDERGS